MNKFKRIITAVLSFVLMVTLSGCAPKRVREFLNTPMYAEQLEGYLELTVYDGEKFYDTEYISHSDKVVITGRAEAKVTPSMEETEAPITIKVIDREKKKCIAKKDTVLKIHPVQYYAADIIARGWKTNRQENYIFYISSTSDKYGNNYSAKEKVEVTFSFETMILTFELASSGYNSMTGETSKTNWELFYSPVEHKIYDKDGNSLYTDRVNTTTVIPGGTARFLTHIDALDRYFRYINQTEYLSGLNSTKIDDLLG